MSASVEGIGLEMTGGARLHPFRADTLRSSGHAGVIDFSRRAAGSAGNWARGGMKKRVATLTV
jgi:hypothetical protein